MYSTGRPSCRLAVAAATMVIAVATTGALLSVRHARRPPRPAATASSAPAEASAARFYAAVKVAMVPLLRHVQTMDSFLRQVNDYPDPSPAVGSLAAAWADDMATSRDLVGRLIAYPGADGGAARTLFENGAALYRESALALTRLPDERNAAGRLGIVRSAARLRLLADRTLDLGKRVVRAGGGGGGTARPASILPEPVPDFTRAEDQCTVPVPVQGYTTLTDDSSGSAWHRWISQHRATLTAAVATLDNQPGAGDARAPSGGPAPALTGDLRAASASLAGAEPEPASTGQGTNAIRLALLVDAEAACAKPTSGTTDDRAVSQERRLRVIGDSLWSVGARLVVHGGHRWPEGLYPRPTELDPTALRTGGVFGGHPPALAPGDPPDLGIPGGLQLPDPLEVLGGP